MDFAPIGPTSNGHGHLMIVHQASGMVSVQANRNVADALALLVSYSEQIGRDVGDVARDVVYGRLRFDVQGHGAIAS